MAIRNSITHHATPADLTAGLVIGGGNAVAQLQDEALVVSLDGGVKFDYRADGASMTADNVYVVADATDTTGKWVRKNVSSLLANVDVAYSDLADNTDTGTIDVPVTGVVDGGAYVVGVTNAIGKIETTVYQVVTDGILPIVFGNNTGTFLPAGTFNINVYKFAGEVGANTPTTPYVRKTFLGEVTPLVTTDEYYHSGNPSLTGGVQYVRAVGVSGDLSNVGEATQGVPFVATGITPNDWGDAVLVKIVDLPTLIVKHNALGITLSIPNLGVSFVDNNPVPVVKLQSSAALFTQSNFYSAKTIKAIGSTDGSTTVGIRNSANIVPNSEIIAELV